MIHTSIYYSLPAMFVTLLVYSAWHGGFFSFEKFLFQGLHLWVWTCCSNVLMHYITDIPLKSGFTMTTPWSWALYALGSLPVIGWYLTVSWVLSKYQIRRTPIFTGIVVCILGVVTSLTIILSLTLYFQPGHIEGQPYGVCE